jgi:hypothetical protein
MSQFVRLSMCGAVAVLLAACSGGGGSIPPQSPSQPASSTSTGTDYTSLSPFTAQDNETGTVVQVYPTRDVIDATGLRAALRLSNSNPNLVYHGGPVQTAPKLYVVFWGASWQSSSGDPDHVANRLLLFYGVAGGSAWLNTVTQYKQADGTPVGNGGTIFGGSYVDISASVPARPTQSQIAAEALRGASHFGDLSANASYVIALPHGIKPSGFGTQYCAWHTAVSDGGNWVGFTNLPYMPDAGYSCGANSVASVLDGVTIVGGHEQAETETDPQLNAWYDSAGNEIADKCAWQNLEANPAAGGYPTQPLWSNATSSCVQSS